MLVVVGPTCSGKTRVSILAAGRLGGEIVSADSRQMYRHMDIGTAKPTPAERALVPHHFVDEFLPDAGMSAGEFGRRGREAIEAIVARGRVPVVAGGSGLYVRALIDGFFEGPARDAGIRGELAERAAKEGAAALHAELQSVDPESAGRIHPGNSRRVIRALEVYLTTGIPLSRLHSLPVATGLSPVMAGLAWDRAALYRRIDERVDAMIAAGLVRETEELRRLGYGAALQALQTVGTREAYLHLDGRIGGAEMADLIKRNTRRYAKRQLTWFRADPRIRWFPVSAEGDFEAVAEHICLHFAGRTRRDAASF